MSLLTLHGRADGPAVHEQGTNDPPVPPVSPSKSRNELQATRTCGCEVGTKHAMAQREIIKRPGTPMKVSTNTLLLALRAPNSGWLAALICALDEALRDPDFGEPQRALIHGLLDAGSVQRAVAVAANDRLTRFEETVKDLHSQLVPGTSDPAAEISARPNLTLCGNAA